MSGSDQGDDSTTNVIPLAKGQNKDGTIDKRRFTLSLERSVTINFSEEDFNLIDLAIDKLSGGQPTVRDTASYVEYFALEMVKSLIKHRNL